MKRKTLFSWLGIIVMLFLVAIPGMAAGMRAKTELGFGGYTVPGRWAPLRIELEKPVNNGRIEIIRYDQSGRAVLRETFPAHNPHIECPVFINEELKSVAIRMIAGGEVIGEKRMDAHGNMFPGHLFLTVNASVRIQHALEGILLPQEPVLAVPVGIAELPFSLFNYDGVSGVVMADPGPVLKPAQVAAFKAWISGGGCAVIYGNPSEAESLIPLLKIDSRNQKIKNEAIHNISIGFGHLILIPGDSQDILINPTPSGWQQLIKLPLFHNTPRLALNNCFPNQGFKPKPVDLRFALILGLGLWMLFSLIIVSVKKGGLVYLSLFTVLTVAAAVPAANYLGGLWHRGYNIRCYALNLPESGGTIIKGEMAAAENSLWTLKTAPWGVAIDFGQTETGIFRLGRGGRGRERAPLQLSEWRHLNARAFSTLYRADISHSNYFIGWLPAAADSRLIPGASEPAEFYLCRPAGKVYPVPKRDYQRWAEILNRYSAPPSFPESDWIPISHAPLWLKEAQDWLKHLSATAPAGTEWIIGRRTSAVPWVTIQKSPNMEFIWVLPLRNNSAYGMR